VRDRIDAAGAACGAPVGFDQPLVAVVVRADGCWAW
jgi:hypothetical protein